MTTKILPGATGVLALADGTILQGVGVGAGVASMAADYRSRRAGREKVQFAAMQ